MENTSNELAQELLLHCLDGSPWPEALLDSLLQPEATGALFRVVVERLADLFEPRLCDVYADLFAEAIARTVPGLHAPHLVERYRRVRGRRRLDRDPSSIQNVFVLSRVTLGADIAVTSVILDAAKKCFESAEIYFVGLTKGWDLFAADPKLEHLPVSYSRSGSLEERLALWPVLRNALSAPNSIVIDPDSRLTQLGLLPVCAEEDYYFFESRSYGGESNESVAELAQRWVSETFGVSDATPYIAPIASSGDPVEVSVSFGVGHNLEKRVPDPFEAGLLGELARRNLSILVDRGAGGEEAERVERAVAQAGASVREWDGSFAGFAAQIARSDLYIGYDSAGGHAAAASGVPVISVFAGFPSERMMQRWRPTGRAPIDVVRAADPGSTLDAVLGKVPF